MKPIGGYKTMAKDQICCFNIFTAASIVGILQSVLIVICLSTTGIVLDHWETWKTDFQRNHDMYVAIPKTVHTGVPLFTVTRSSTTSYQTTPSSTMSPILQYPMQENSSWFHDVGLETFVQIHLAHHIAIYSIWLSFMLLYAWSFREMRPILVLPNLVMQFVTLIIMIILGGTLIARMVKLSRQYKNSESMNEDMQMNDIEMRYAFHAVLLAWLFVAWIVELVFTYVGYKYYVYLRDQMQNMFPEIPTITFPNMNPRRVSSALRHNNDVNIVSGGGGGGEIIMTTNMA